MPINWQAGGMTDKNGLTHPFPFNVNPARQRKLAKQAELGIKGRQWRRWLKAAERGRQPISRKSRAVLEILSTITPDPEPTL